VPDLDGVTEPLWQAFQEVFEDVHPLDGEGRRKLQEQGSEPVPEFGDRAQKASGLGLGTDQVRLVGDLLGVLYTTRKSAHFDPRRHETMSIAPS
jgi:hypothetical protein